MPGPLLSSWLGFSQSATELCHSNAMAKSCTGRHPAASEEQLQSSTNQGTWHSPCLVGFAHEASLRPWLAHWHQHLLAECWTNRLSIVCWQRLQAGSLLTSTSPRSPASTRAPCHNVSCRAKHGCRSASQVCGAQSICWRHAGFRPTSSRKVKEMPGGSRGTRGQKVAILFRATTVHIRETNCNRQLQQVLPQQFLRSRAFACLPAVQQHHQAVAHALLS